MVFVSSPWEDDCVALSFLSPLSLSFPSLFCGVLGFPGLTPWLPLPGTWGLRDWAAPDARGREWIVLQVLDLKTSERARAEPEAVERRLGFLFRPLIYLAF